MVYLIPLMAKIDLQVNCWVWDSIQYTPTLIGSSYLHINTRLCILECCLHESLKLNLFNAVL